MAADFLDAVRRFEGFTPRAQWDYKQHSNGYGTRAQYPGEVIDRDEAERRLQSEVAKARAIVDQAVPNADEGTKAALTSLTFNSGADWVNAGLGQAVKAGDLDTARARFVQYINAGGSPDPGLISRRGEEAKWIGNPDAFSGQAPTQLASAPAAEPVTGSPAPMSIVSAAAPQVPAASDPLAGLGIGRLLGAGVDNPSAQEVADIAPIPMGMARRVNMAKLQAALAKRSPLGFYRA